MAVHVLKPEVNIPFYLSLAYTGAWHKDWLTKSFSNNGHVICVDVCMALQ